MPRRSRRRAPKRSNRKESTPKKSPIFAWAINFVIASLGVVIIGFVYSSIQRIQVNDQAVDLSLEETINKYEEKSLAAKLYEQKQYPDIWVEVLNGNGVPGVAAEFTEFLRDQGFDVQRTDNADKFSYQNTLVIDRSDEREKALAVAQVLQIDTSEVQTKVNESIQLDVSVVLGQDYKTLPVYQKIKQLNLP